MDDGSSTSAPDTSMRAHPTRDRIWSWGGTAWRLVGFLLAASMIYTLIAAFSGLIIDDAVSVVRRGFGALIITSLVTSAVIGAAMLVLGLPLVLTVVVVTFLTSYIPYLGAILSGGFVFLIALGSGSVSDAIVMLVVVLIAQNVIQTIVGNRLTSDRLQLHPLPSIISSVCGVAIAGLLGAMLSAPVLALALAVARRLEEPEMVRGIG